MASFVVDGVVIPISVAGHPALDFCNTRAGWGSPTPKEYLHSHGHLSVWARENSLIETSAVSAMTRAAASDPVAAAAVVARAVTLRDALYTILTNPEPNAGPIAGPIAGRAAGPDAGRASCWTVVDHEIRRAANASALTHRRPSRWAVTDRSNVDLPLLTVVWSMVELLTSPAAADVGACPGPGCGWLFVNPRGRRRWCSMAWCGNRDKVRRHASRTRGTSSPTDE